jgi:iron complex transport system ATP-binding protein
MIANTPQSMDTLQPFFRVSGFNLRVGQTHVTQDLAFEVFPGEMVAILGKNGVGKSTLLSNLAGLPRGDSSGAVLLHDKSYADWGARAAACWRGWLSQKQQDQFSATVLETVLSGRHPHLSRWAWESAGDHAIAMASLAAVGMTTFAERDVLTLSGGERQRVAIATILTQNPTLYFMDEPLAHLDLNHQIEVMNLLRAKSKTEHVSNLMVLHEPGLAHRYCDSALLLFGEGKWLYGSADSILTAENLSCLYGYPLVQIDQTDEAGKMHRWFLPA